MLFGSLNNEDKVFTASYLTSLSPSRYIQAATSPKDVVIVVDVSGSMKGLRLTIAKHTINTILDTLGENDFVNIIAVSLTDTHNHKKPRHT